MGLGKQQKKNRRARLSALADFYGDDSNGSESEDELASKRRKVGGGSVQSAMVGEDMTDPSGDEDEDEDADGDEGDECDASDGEVVPAEGTPAEVAAMAIDEIRTAISNADVQAGGITFIPAHWAKRYKHMLGPYKKFLEMHPDKFVLDEGEKGGFIVYNYEDVERPPVPKHMPWKAAIVRAWGVYCKEVPKSERDFRIFLSGGLPENARGVAGGGAAFAGEGLKAPEQVGNCPGEHGLTIFETAAEGWSCNRCSHTARLGAKLYGCRTCDYDICAGCYIGGEHRAPCAAHAAAAKKAEESVVVSKAPKNKAGKKGRKC